MTFLGLDTKDTIFENIEPNVDIPMNDEVAYKQYPKYNWVYSTSRLFDFQKIDWTPFGGGQFTHQHAEFPVTGGGGYVYTMPLDGEVLTTDVAVMKGDIKWAKHHIINEKGEKEVLDDLRGGVELRISALTTIHFQKFAGVISVDTIGNVITSVRLCMTADVVDQYPEDWLKRVLRIYNRRPWGK